MESQKPYELTYLYLELTFFSWFFFSAFFGFVFFLKSIIWINNSTWFSSASSKLILLLSKFLVKDLVVSQCRKSYVSFIHTQFFFSFQGFFYLLIFSISFWASSLNLYYGIPSSLVNCWASDFKTFKACIYFFPWSSVILVCFSKAFPKEW